MSLQKQELNSQDVQDSQDYGIRHQAWGLDFGNVECGFRIAELKDIPHSALRNQHSEFHRPKSELLKFFHKIRYNGIKGKK